MAGLSNGVNTSNECLSFSVLIVFKLLMPVILMSYIQSILVIPAKAELAPHLMRGIYGL